MVNDNAIFAFGLLAGFAVGYVVMNPSARKLFTTRRDDAVREFPKYACAVGVIIGAPMFMVLGLLAAWGRSELWGYQYAGCVLGMTVIGGLQAFVGWYTHAKKYRQDLQDEEESQQKSQQNE